MKVTLLRRRGVPVLKAEDREVIGPAYLFCGDYFDDGLDRKSPNRKPRACNRVAWLAEPATNNTRRRLGWPICDPEIVSADEHSMIIKGVERLFPEAGGDVIEEHIQVWLCVFVEPVIRAHPPPSSPPGKGA